MDSKKAALAIVFTWFAIGGVAHLIVPDFFLKIVPPSLPFRLEAVYLSGFFELLGALALLCARLRRAAGLGLCALTITVTPANIYMWAHPELFPAIPHWVLTLRLLLQVLLLATIWWATQPQGKRVGRG